MAVAGSSRLISGRADYESTHAYFEDRRGSYHDYKDSSWLTDTPGGEYRVSRLGFGTYRVQRGVRSFFDALREALLAGTNVIDTAANYADGEAESLVGDVLAELLDVGRIRREHVVIVSKAGYIQGRLLDHYRKHTERYHEALRFGPDLLHCIQPEFLSDEIDFSRRRMRLESVDVFLLHNPEYFLRYALAAGMSAEEARTEFERRLGRAFACLEDLADRGRLSYYGISSNTFAVPEETPDALHLDRVLALAGPRFRVIQFPANLVENDFRFSRLSGGGNLCEQARAAKLWTLSNRPLNAMMAGRGLVRLARMAQPPPDDGASTVAEFQRLASRLEEVEAETLRIFGDRHFRFDERTPSPADIVRHYRHAFSNKESFRRNRIPLTEEIQRTVNHLRTVAEREEERYAVESLVRLSNAVFGIWEKFADMRYHHRMEYLEQALSGSSPALQGRPLARQAVLFLLCRPEPATVLVGMRNTAYVRQLHEIYAEDLPGSEEALPIVTAAEQALEEMP